MVKSVFGQVFAPILERNDIDKEQAVRHCREAVLFAIGGESRELAAVKAVISILGFRWVATPAEGAVTPQDLGLSTEDVGPRLIIFLGASPAAGAFGDRKTIELEAAGCAVRVLSLLREAGGEMGRETVIDGITRRYLTLLSAEAIGGKEAVDALGGGGPLFPNF